MLFDGLFCWVVATDNTIDSIVIILMVQRSLQLVYCLWTPFYTQIRHVCRIINVGMLQKSRLVTWRKLVCIFVPLLNAANEMIQYCLFREMESTVVYMVSANHYNKHTISLHRQMPIAINVYALHTRTPTDACFPTRTSTFTA